MRPEFIGLFVPIFTVLGAFTMVVFLRRYENIERLAALERGFAANELKYLWGKQTDKHRFVRFAATLIGIGIGLVVSGLLHTWGLSKNVTIGIVFIFGGLGLLAGYFAQYALERRAAAQERPQGLNDTQLL